MERYLTRSHARPFAESGGARLSDVPVEPARKFLFFNLTRFENVKPTWAARKLICGKISLTI